MDFRKGLAELVKVEIQQGFLKTFCLLITEAAADQVGDIFDAATTADTEGGWDSEKQKLAIFASP